MTFEKSVKSNIAVAAGVRRQEEEKRGLALSSSSTSSIGRNSDELAAVPPSSNGGAVEGGAGGSGEGEEVQSEFKGGPLDSLQALESVLPIKRGISEFYSGKSVSFTSLGDAESCNSIKDIAKPENPFTRKRKYSHTFDNFWNKKQRKNVMSDGGDISKRSTAMGLSESNSESSYSASLSPATGLPPLPLQSRRSSDNVSSALAQSQNASPPRSFSENDMQGAAPATPSNTGLFGDNEK